MRFDFERLDFVNLDIEPNKLAIAGSDKNLTWSEFKYEVDILKGKLITLDLPPGHPVIIYGHKEVKFIISIVACMSLGYPYIPVDTSYPDERLFKIKDISKSAIIINCTSDKIIFFKENIETSLHIPNDPIIYIIFTSGSTGEPKGVQITHSAILSYNHWIDSDFPFCSSDVFVDQAPFSFDLSVYELFGFLLYGATIVSFSRPLISEPAKFIKRLKDYSCSVWISTPSFVSLSMMINEFNSQNLSNLTKFIFCGETLPPMTVKKLFSQFEDINVYNSYGPTEACVATTLVNITIDTLNKYTVLPVGSPKKTSKINLLHTEIENGHEIGEIEIVGDNVSIGYFNNEALNTEKFPKNNESRTFKTGDYGYFKDNMLFFAGRRDDLIKLHGFRIEIDEIDNSFKTISYIKNSTTIALKRRDEVVKLVTFIILKDKKDHVSNDALKNEISNYLPYYMIPSDIIQVDELPYNINHKVDKKALIELYKTM